MTYSSSIRARVDAARVRIEGHVCHTPLLHARSLSEITGARVLLKLENLQRTGSFKWRGALNRLLLFTEAERTAGFVAASSGNHGIALATAASMLNIPGLVVLPEGASSGKADRLKSLGVEVLWHGNDCVLAEAHGRVLADETGRTFVSPYNDPEVMAGQGTLILEALEDEHHVDVAFVTIGGGGLMGGVGSALRSACPEVALFGCQPRASAIMAHSVRAGAILDLPSEETLSDGSAGGLEADSITFAICRELVDDFLLVSEAEIAHAIRLMVTQEKLVIEGAAGAAVAGLLAHAASGADLKGKTVLVVICGGNIGAETLANVLDPAFESNADQ